MICANQTSPAGLMCRPCECSKQVAAELEDQDRREGAGVRPNDNGGDCR